MNSEKIPFNKPYLTGKELEYIAATNVGNKLAGDGPFTMRCHEWMENGTGCAKALLTHSCTAALEMASLLLDVAPGDEIIMPSYTFVSTANAFVLRGGIPVFVDIREDTLNIDERLIEAAISPRTKAIVVVHYAGVACEMDAIGEIASRHGIKIVEDAAQGVMARYKGKMLGSIGDLGCYSFHETKNIISGEGGALLVSNHALAERAEIIREKGTDRSRFFRGEVDKYTWQDVGSSFLPGEMVAAFLWAQFENAQEITNERLAIWERYHIAFSSLEQAGLVRRPIIPDHCKHNAHMYYLLLAPGIERQKILDTLRNADVHAVSHYVPLHSSPAGSRYCKVHGTMSVTENISERLIRLPLWIGLTGQQQGKIVDLLRAALNISA